jgi:hypothetical protein
MDYCKLDNDKWADCGKIWAVLEYSSSSKSTAVKLVLEDTDTKEVHSRVVARNQIEWLEEKDSSWLEVRNY